MKRLLSLALACALACLLPLLPALAQDAAPADLDPSAFRGIPWTWDSGQVLAAEGGKALGGAVVASGDALALYDLAASRVTYRFDEDGHMASRTFLMRRASREAYVSLFYSLFLRYGLPVSAGDSLARWQGQDMSITLRRGDELEVTYEWLPLRGAEIDK